MLRSLRLTILVLLATAPAAAADLLPMDVRSLRPPQQRPNVAGPVLAGDRVVWAEQSTGLEYRVRSWRRGEPPRDVGTLPVITDEWRPYEDRQVGLAASPSRVLASVLDVAYGDRIADYSRASVWTGPLSGPLTELSRRAQGQNPSRSSVLATEGAHAVDHVIFAEDAPGAAGVSFPGESVRALAGDLALLGSTGTLRVVRWREGGELYRFDATGVVTTALQADGKAALVLRRGDVLVPAWTSREEPFPHPLPVEERSGFSVAIGGDRIAYATEQDVGVLTLDGRVVQLYDAPDRFADVTRGAAGFAFDGTRLAWNARRCAATFVVSTTVGEPPPRLPDAQCRPPRPSPYVFRLDRRGGWVTVTLTCPAAAANGCDGTVDVRLQGERSAGNRTRLRPVAQFGSALLAGGTETRRLRLPPAARRTARAFRGLRVRVRAYETTEGSSFVQRTYRLGPRAR